MYNPNFALHKRVLEECNTPEAMLDGCCHNFDGTKGYCGVHVPAYITIDLGSNCPIGYIRFLLMNRENEDTNHGVGPRQYYYRLLACEDTDCINNTTEWKVLYDSLGEGFVDWQCFTLSSPLQVRYLRIHTIDNRKNNGFHIVQFEAYEHSEPLPDGERVAVNAEITTEKVQIEVGDGMPLYKRLHDIAGIVTTIMKDQFGRSYLQMNIPKSDMPLMNKSVMNMISYDEATKSYNIQGSDIQKIISNFANDVKILERNSDGIERAVISPVQAAMTESRRSNTRWTYWGLLSSIIGLVLLIVTMVVKM